MPDTENLSPGFDQCKVRQAEKMDGPLLTALRRRSKGYWGYPAEWVRRVEGEITVPLRSPDAKNLMFVLQQGKQILGFYSLIRWDVSAIELDDFFLDLPYIGKGFGKQLWDDAVIRSKNLGHEILEVIADPNAEGFYLKQGALKIGEVISKADPARILSRLQYSLTER